ncbi:hypothetical protein ACLOJK_027359 [Asimina triloba]
MLGCLAGMDGSPMDNANCGAMDLGCLSTLPELLTMGLSDLDRSLVGGDELAKLHYRRRPLLLAFVGGDRRRDRFLLLPNLMGKETLSESGSALFVVDCYDLAVGSGDDEAATLMGCSLL